MRIFTLFITLILFQTSANAQQNIDGIFCNALRAIVDDANNYFELQTNRDRVSLLNHRSEENRFEAEIILPGFFYGKIVTRGTEGLYYESVAPNIADSSDVLQGLKNVDRHILHCIQGIKRNPISEDGLHYGYHYQVGDTMQDIFIRLWGEYPEVDEENDTFAGQINIEIYGDDRRQFTPYTPNAKKKDTTLIRQFATIEQGLLDDIDLIKGKESEDLYKNKIWRPKLNLKGAGDAFIKPLPETLLMPFGYYADLYVGPNLADAQKTYNLWIGKVKNNAFADKRFSQKNRKHLQWQFLPYNEWFDPDDYANIIQQVGFSCPDYSLDPINRTPLFTYHLFILKYAGDYIVGLSIGNRY